MAFLTIIVGCESAATSITGPTAAKCQLIVQTPTTVVAEGGAVTIAVNTQPECGWSVSTQTSWISGMSPTSGQGNGSVEVQFARNTVPTSREGEILFNEERVRLAQEAAPCRFTLVPPEADFGSAGGNGSVGVSVLTGCTWTARSNAAWITVMSGQSGSGDGSVAYSVASNPGAGRASTIVVGDRTLNIRQVGTSPAPPPASPTCSYAIDPTSRDVSAAGGATSTTVTATSGCTWAAASNVSWISITRGVSGQGNGSVELLVELNNGISRTGTLTIAGRTFTVNQATTCTWRLDRNNFSVREAGATRTVNVTARTGCTWGASSSVPWIIMTSSTGNGDGIASFIITPNLGPERTATVTVAGQTVSVWQRGVS